MAQITEVPIGLRTVTALVPSVRAYGEPEEVTVLVPVNKLPRAKRTQTYALRYALKESSRMRRSGLSINIPIADGVPAISRSRLGQRP